MVYETDFGMFRIVDESPTPFYTKPKPNYMTDRVAYLRWKKEKQQYYKYECALSTMLDFLWSNGKNISDYEWRDGWLIPKGKA